MGVYPMWMNKRSCISVEIRPSYPSSGGSGGGGFTIAYKEKEFPIVRIKKVITMDDYEYINIKVLKVVDLSLSGGN